VPLAGAQELDRKGMQLLQCGLEEPAVGCVPFASRDRAPQRRDAGDVGAGKLERPARVGESIERDGNARRTPGSSEVRDGSAQAAMRRPSMLGDVAASR